jgi:hypothetical protein
MAPPDQRAAMIAGHSGGPQRSGLLRTTSLERAHCLRGCEVPRRRWLSGCKPILLALFS